jgi:Rrf2 family protein
VPNFSLPLDFYDGLPVLCPHAKGHSNEGNVSVKLSRTAAYALKATLQLAQADDGSPVPCSRLAAEGRMPERFLLQVLRNLVRHGILGSTRGIDGGYSLRRSPADISLLEVIEAVDGPLNSASPLPEGLPEESRTTLECALRDVTEHSRHALRAVKLDRLLPEVDGYPNN